MQLVFSQKMLKVQYMSSVICLNNGDISQLPFFTNNRAGDLEVQPTLVILRLDTATKFVIMIRSDMTPSLKGTISLKK